MNEKLNIQNLIELLAEKHGMDKADAGSFVKEFFQLIEESLENDKYVKIRGLGTFKLIDVESRESVNINTGAYKSFICSGTCLEGLDKQAFFSL